MTTIECHCLHLGESWLNAGIRTSSQPTLYVGWDVATAESQQSELGDDNDALYTTPVHQASPTWPAPRQTTVHPTAGMYLCRYLCFEKEGVGKILLDKSPSIPIFE